jgi:hypothetical protein
LKECRKKNLAFATPIDEDCFAEIYASPEVYATSSGPVPELSNFSLGTPIDVSASTKEAAQGLCELSGVLPRSHPTPDYVHPSQSRRCRKRGRTSSDDRSSLQNNVRHLMALDARKEVLRDGNTVGDDDAAVVADTHVASSFLLPQPKAIQTPSACQFGAVKRPLPLSLPKSTGSMKRACCGEDSMTGLTWGVSGNETAVLD